MALMMVVLQYILSPLNVTFTRSRRDWVYGCWVGDFIRFVQGLSLYFPSPLCSRIAPKHLEMHVTKK